MWQETAFVKNVKALTHRRNEILIAEAHDLRDDTVAEKRRCHGTIAFGGKVEDIESLTCTEEETIAVMEKVSHGYLAAVEDARLFKDMEDATVEQGIVQTKEVIAGPSCAVAGRKIYGVGLWKPSPTI